METLYCGFIRPILEYGDVLFAGAFEKGLNKINRIELHPMKIASGAISKCSTALLKLELGWENISVRRMNHVLIMLYRIVASDAPVKLLNIFLKLTSINTDYNLRNSKLRPPLCKTTKYRNSFFPLAIRNFNL